METKHSGVRWMEEEKKYYGKVEEFWPKWEISQTILKEYAEGNSKYNPKIKTIQYCGNVAKCERKMQLYRRGQRNC